ncbi:atrial natriuretic peptide receptor 2-like [Acanthaster planci]|uniref:Guanylate cyclase n=1 Tax=Acanthaster planci TaxID=133434 RepID=A0A8B7ZPT5_ACAPL|nr:atrial natriuretic peptide receptor 2-like [Acanthaster planci]
MGSMGLFVLLIQAMVCFNFVGSNDHEDIVLGLMLPFSGQWPVGRYIAGAMTVAVDDVNSNENLLKGRNVTFIWNDTTCAGKNGLYQAVNMWLYVHRLHAFIGGGCDVVCEPVGLLASAWNLPMVSWGCSSLVLSNKDDYNTFVRTVGPYTKMARMFTKIMRSFSWTRTVILTSSENVWQTTSYAVKLDLESEGILVSDFFTFNPGHENITGREKMQHRDVIVDAKESARIFLLFAYGGDVRDLMLNSLDLGLINGEFAFVCVDLIEDAHYGRNTWMGDDGRDEDAAKAFNGLLNIHIKTPEEDSYEAFKAEARHWVAEEPFNRPMGQDEEVDVHAGPLYDAVWLYASALHDVLEEGGNEYDGLAVARKMRNRKFRGVDGNVTIDQNGDRNPDYALQDLHNGKFEDFAYYDHETMHLVFRDDFTPTWPGGGTKPPSGEPECGWDNEYCQTNTVAIIAGVSCSVFVLIVIAACVTGYFYRRLKMEAELQSISLWRVNFDEVVFDTRKTLSYHSGGSVQVMTATPFFFFFDTPVAIIAGVSCSVFVLIVIAACVTGYFYRRLKMEAELQSISLWRVNFDEVVFDTRKTLSYHSGGSVQSHSNGPLSLGSNPVLTGGRNTSSSNRTDIQKFCDYGVYKGYVVAIKNVRKKSVALSREQLIEISMVRNFKHENINTFIGACIDHPNVCILMEYSNKGSLQDVLENDDVKLDDNFKLSFAMDIIPEYELCVNHNSYYFLSNGSTLFEASLWTAPELLRCPPPSPYGTPEGDIYSFGIILQEIVIRGGPYCTQALEPKEIVTAVKMGARPVFRPVLPKDACSPQMIELMELCWAERPTDRPNISRVKSSIQKLSGGKAQNLVDNMIGMMEKYADHLEELVNERTQQLEEEKKKTDQLLHQMLPRSVAAQLKRGDVVTAEQYEQVTVYFSDIVGFTRLASESTPFQVVELLNDLYTLFDDTIDNYDIYKVETIGDAYMVASGVPERNGNRHAAEISSLALDLLSSVKSFKIRHRPTEQLQLRTGIHTGPVVAGVVGLKMPRFCLFGDTVNTASRMESNGLALRIHISSATCEVLSQIGGFKIELRGEITVKGKAPMTTYWLVGKEKVDFDLPDLCLAASPTDHSDQTDELPGTVTSSPTET